MEQATSNHPPVPTFITISSNNMLQLYSASSTTMPTHTNHQIHPSVPPVPSIRKVEMDAPTLLPFSTLTHNRSSVEPIAGNGANNAFTHPQPPPSGSLGSSIADEDMDESGGHVGVGVGGAGGCYVPITGVADSLGGGEGEGGGSGMSMEDGTSVGNTDAEGVWSADIDQAFQEALAIYPPCGRRKIILSEEGKMYGRNELIARYIKLRTGKTRTRKQVSSHIQVLSRRRCKETAASSMSSQQPQTSQPGPQQHQPPNLPQSSAFKLLSSVPTPSVEPILSNSATTALLFPPQLLGSTNGLQQLQTSADVPSSSTGLLLLNPLTNQCPPVQPMAVPQVLLMSGAKLQLLYLAVYISRHAQPLSDFTCFHLPPEQYLSGSAAQHPDWHLLVRVNMADTPVLPSPAVGDPPHQSQQLLEDMKPVPGLLHLLEPLDITQISDKFPERNGLKDLFERGPPHVFFLMKIWADVDTELLDDDYFGSSIVMQCRMNLSVRLNTKICSFGKQVVEKIEDCVASCEEDRYLYRFNKAEMCDYMKSFITKLLQLSSRRMMNSVLENFTILQVATHPQTHETLLCLAYVFEVSQSGCGSQHKLYRLVSGTTAGHS